MLESFSLKMVEMLEILKNVRLGMLKISKHKIIEGFEDEIKSFPVQIPTLESWKLIIAHEKGSSMNQIRCKQL